MARTGSVKYGLTLSGSLLGAGFLSGNELMRFFGIYGLAGIIGCFFSVLLIAAFALMIARISKKTNAGSAAEILFLNNCSFLGGIISSVQLLLTVCITMIMTAGAAELLSNLSGLSFNLSAGIFCFAGISLICFGVGGISRLLNLSVPIIAVFSLAVMLAVLKSNRLQLTSIDSKNIVAAAIQALLYSAFSVVVIIGVIPVLSKRKFESSAAFGGTVIFGAVLLLCSMAILLSIMPNTSLESIPMLKSTEYLSARATKIYSLLLIIGMLGAAISSVSSALSSAENDFSVTKNGRAALLLLINGIAYFMSALGLNRLVAAMYPIFGYIGIAIMPIITVNFIKTKK